MESSERTQATVDIDRERLLEFPPFLAEHALLAAIVGVVAAEFMFASMGVAIRLASAEANNQTVVFIRNIVGVAVLLPWLLHRRGIRLRTDVYPLHLLRAVVGLGAMYCFYYALAHIPLADAMLLKLTAPLFIPLIAFFWLGERAPVQVAWALLLGFTGVLITLQPSTGSISPVALVALLGGVLAAVAKVTIRRLSRSERSSTIVFYFAVHAAVMSFLPWFASAPTDFHLQTGIWLIAVGLLATAGQFLITIGLSLRPAAQLAPFGYFSLIFGATYGWLMWQEPLGLSTMAGALFIIAGGLLAGRARMATQAPRAPKT